MMKKFGGTLLLLCVSTAISCAKGSYGSGSCAYNRSVYNDTTKIWEKNHIHA